MRKRIRGWRALLVAIALLAALMLVDTWLTRTGSADYCPDDAKWIVTADDFPAFYRNLLETDLAKAINDEAPEHYAAWQLAVRQATGIRPTPLRCRVWLGSRFLAAVSEDGWGACVRPGILLRVADSLRGLGAWRPSVRQFGPYYYAWRDGALIFSKSEKYVLATLEAQVFLKYPPDIKRANTLWVYETREGHSAVSIRPGRQIYITGWVDGGHLSSRETPLTLAAWPPDAAIAWAAASKCRDLYRLATLLRDQIDSHTQISARPWFGMLKKLLQEAVAPWLTEPLPDNWDEQVAECSFALLGIDDSETLPVPELGLVLRSRNSTPGTHPLEPLIGSGPALPYEWDGHPGVVAPCAGEKAAVCLSSFGTDWLAASQEPAMAALMSAVQQTGVQCRVPNEALVAINWSKTVEVVQSLAQKAAKLELLPRMNSADLEKTVMPLLRALARQENAHLHLWMNRQRLEFKGALTGGTCQ